MYRDDKGHIVYSIGRRTGDDPVLIAEAIGFVKRATPHLNIDNLFIKVIIR